MKDFNSKAAVRRLVAICMGAVAGILLSSTAIAAPVNAKNLTGFVQIAPDRSLFVDYEPPAAGQPVIVLINGLTYSTTTWDAFVHELQGKGIGILRYDPVGMGQTLLKYGIPKAAVDYRDQVNDLRLLLDAMGITQPVHVLGLSYGGALALEFGHEFPDRVASLIVMAPFVAPLETQDNWIRMQVQQTRLLNPWIQASYDELYDYFLHINILTTYPAAEPVVLENPYKLEAIFKMVQGIRKFLAKDISMKLPHVGVHLVIAKQDQYIDNKVHDDFWEMLPAAARTSRLYVTGSEHKIPEAVPWFAAQWVQEIVKGNPKICCGRTFTGNPWNGEVISQDAKINLK